MSDFKIAGNPNPVVGKEEFYSIGNPVAKTFPYTAIPKSPFDTPVLWTVHILENGRWRKTKENDKRGDKVSYTFLQRSLGRKGIRIMATRGEQTARLDIDTHPADKPKIDSIDLLDKSGKKPAKPLSYGQTLKARVHCLHMEKRKVFVTLWEDDAKGAGHNKENEKNIIETRWGFVEDGIADVDFLLRPSFAKIATRGGEEKDKIHEYYVTTNFDSEKLASNNVNVNELDAPVAPFKGKVPVQQPVKNIPGQQPKTQAPAAPVQAKPKGAISSVKITDADGNTIKGVFRDKQIKVWIYSTGLAGKEIRLKLYDEDYVSNDLLVDQKFTITKDIFPIIVTLNKIPRSRGGDTGEGAEQEVFADVEVLESNKHTVSAVVDVDAKAFKPDPVSDSNTVFKIFQPEKKDEDKKDEKEKCPRCEILTAEEMTKIFTGASVADKDILRKAFNDANKKFGLNTCQQKAHFFAQVMEEVGVSINVNDGENLNYKAEDLPKHFARFRIDSTKKYNEITNGPNDLAYKYGRSAQNGYVADQKMIANITYANKEDNGDMNSGDGWKYRGRGIIQITFKRKYTNINRRIKDDYPEFNVVIDADNINNLKEGTVASMAYWEEYKCQEVASKGYSKKELDAIVDIINKDTESRSHRWTNLQSCVKIFKIDECKNANPKKIEVGDIHKYKIEIDKFKYDKIMTSPTSSKYQYEIFDSGTLKKTIILDKNEHNLLPFPDTGINWGRFGTRDSGGDNWVDEKVCAALLGFFYSLPKNNYADTLYFNDISANDGRNIGHSGHRIGNDIDIRYPGSTNSSGAILWSKAAESYKNVEEFLKVLENILEVSSKWGFNKNYAYKVGIKNTTGKATAIHQDHFHLGLR